MADLSYEGGVMYIVTVAVQTRAHLCRYHSAGLEFDTMAEARRYARRLFVEKEAKNPTVEIWSRLVIEKPRKMAR